MTGVQHRLPRPAAPADASPAAPADGSPAAPADDSAEQLYEQAPCGYLSTALDGTIVRVNQTLLGWLGYRREDVVGRRRFADLLPAGPRVIWQTHHVQQLAATGSVTGVALDLVRADGGRLPALIGALIADPGGESSRIIRLTVFDATERRAYEASLVAARLEAERSERRLRLLQQVTEACATATEPQELLDAVACAATTALDAQGAAVWLGQPEAPVLERAGVRDLHDAVAPQALPSDGTGPFSEAWRTGDVVVVETPERAAERFPALGPVLSAAGAEGLLAVPVRFGEQRLGVLGVLLSRSSPVAEPDLAVLRTIGAQVGQALDRTRMHAELQRLALHDDLTGLSKRVVLADRTAHALARAERAGRSVVLMVLDLDGFKQVNDTYGHHSGDVLLQAIADRLAGAVRAGDVVARLGGDEFAVLCEDADVAGARRVADRILAVVSAPVDLGGWEAGVTASVGIAVCGADRAPVTFEALLAEADAAMYEAKRAGKNRRAVHGHGAHRDDEVEP